MEADASKNEVQKQVVEGRQRMMMIESRRGVEARAAMG
jgi:hypothetical protein